MGDPSLRPVNDAPVTGPLAGKTVLIVEDEAVISESIFDTVMDAGGKPLPPCASIVDALNAINASAIDVALVDVNLNGMRSNAVMQALHAKNIPFVAATAYQIAATLGGAPVILEKPYTPAKLREALEEAINLPPPSSDE
ncbi:MAG TPA: response regulator [Vitreimonas sp.]|jgi:DNA-binding NtrC family response regulator|nr:response regulator [Vitreimonas sp.]